MGLGNLPNITENTIQQDHVNDLRNALRQQFVGRNSSGAPTAGQELGTAAIPWGTLYSKNINVNGKVIDFDNIESGTTNNAIISGRTRTTSGQPDFIRAAGASGGAVFDILATDTDLVYTANSETATVSADVEITGVTLAPSTNNTCLIDDASYTDQDSTKYEGEGTGQITIDTAGSEITDRIGQYVALKAGTEIMMAFVESETVIRNVFRGFFFDSAGVPIVRETLADNDTLTLLSLGWVFGENNGTTFDVSYRSPYIQFDEPASGNTDDYWYDVGTKKWKRYDGSNWIDINRAFLGWIVADTADCIASRSADFSKSFNEFIQIEVEVDAITKVRSTKSYSALSVYGGELLFHGAPFIWDITAHLETGLTEANSTLYYLYITESGEPIISVERPYDRRGDLKGFYHPYNTWRFVGVCYNSSGGDITSANSKNNNAPRVDIFTASGEYLPLPNIDDVKVTVVGSGGANGSGSSGASSSFGSIMTANGGRAGGNDFGSNTDLWAQGGAGGTATGGDLNITGQRGGGSTGNTVYGGTYSFGSGGVSALGTIGGGANGVINGNTIRGAGGGGGTAIKWISNLSSRIAVTVGTTNNDGIVLVEY